MYDPGQQMVFGSDSQPQLLPTHADVLAAFPAWEDHTSLFVPEK